jgi:hypothetical protein
MLHARPALKLDVVQRDTAATTSKDEHPGCDQLMTDMSRRSIALEAALNATRRDDLKHGTNAAYVRGCVCAECREHQRQRMTRNRR